MENLVRWVLGADLSPNTGSDLSGTWPGQATGTEWSGQEGSVSLVATEPTAGHYMGHVKLSQLLTSLNS